MPTASYPPVAREGWPALFLLGLLLLALQATLGPAASLPVLAVFFGLVFLLRDPGRSIPAAPLALLSPVHGRVLGTARVHDPWLQREAECVSLAMSPLGVFSIFSPTEGKVMEQWAQRSGMFGAHDYTFWIQTDEGDDVVLVIHVSNLCLLRFWCYLHSGERVGQGHRFGYLLFGGRIEVLMPTNVNVQVSSGQHVDAGNSLFANLVHKRQVSAVSAP